MGRTTEAGRRRVRRGLLAALAGACIAGSAASGGLPAAAAPRGQAPEPAGAPIDTSDRQQVAQAYRNELKPALNTPGAFTGDLPTCTTGQETAASRAATFDALNFYRRLAGLKPVVDEPAWTQGVMELAVMSAAEGNISHTPPNTWKCWTAAAAEAALRSNLGIGTAGATAIRDYMTDWGVPSGGHRRNILYPPAKRMATGSTGFTNALRVIDDVFQPRPARPKWVAWPPAGFVPRPVLPMQGTAQLLQWSLSSNEHPDADFSTAKVAMHLDGEPLVETLLPVDDRYADNTLLWNAKRSGGKSFPQRGAEITVKVSGIRGVPGAPVSRRYTVRSFVP